MRFKKQPVMAKRHASRHASMMRHKSEQYKPEQPAERAALIPQSANQGGAGEQQGWNLVEALGRYVLTHRRQGEWSIRDLVNQPGSNVLILLMLSVALYIPLMLYTGFQNIHAFQQRVNPNPVATVFFESSLEMAHVQRVAEKWQQFPEVLAVTVVSKSQGMQDLMAMHQLSEGLWQSLGYNPLPAVVKLQLVGLSQAQAISLEQKFKGFSGVERVVLDAVWAERLVYFLSLMQKILYVTVLALAMVVVLTVANVTRLKIENQRDHIQIASLFGASSAFLNRPFLYQGFLFGLGSAVVAIVMLLITKAFISEPLAYLLQSYTINIAVLPLRIGTIVGILVISCCLGILGARLAVRQVLVSGLKSVL